MKRLEPKENKASPTLLTNANNTEYWNTLLLVGHLVWYPSDTRPRFCACQKLQRVFPCGSRNSFSLLAGASAGAQQSSLEAVVPRRYFAVAVICTYDSRLSNLLSAKFKKLHLSTQGGRLTASPQPRPPAADQTTAHCYDCLARKHHSTST
jgi:hypothetical protein